MHDMVATIGAMRFRLSRLEYPVVPPEVTGEPFLTLDGYEVELCSYGGEQFLVIDYRRGRCGPARVEFWECLDASEGRLAGLYAMTDAGGDAQLQAAG